MSPSAGSLIHWTPREVSGTANPLLRTAFASTPYGNAELGWLGPELVSIAFREKSGAVSVDPTAQRCMDRILGGLPPECLIRAIGTPFQLAVWKHLVSIPRGSTTGYLDIARAIGSPGASRAVGNAVGANPLAILIPCHRVIRLDGSLGGYRWGEERKRLLLAAEADPSREPD